MKNQNHHLSNPLRLLSLALLVLLLAVSCGNGGKRGDYARTDNDNPCIITPKLKKALENYNVGWYVSDDLITVSLKTTNVNEAGRNYYPMGCINMNGEVVLPCQYAYVSTHSGMIIARIDKKDGVEYGLFDSQGNKVVPMGKFDVIGDYGGFFGDYAVVKKGSQFGVINKKGNVVIPVEYDDINHFFYPHYYQFENLPDVFIGWKNGKMEYFDLSKNSGKMETKPSTPYDVILVGEYGKQSFLDYQGHIIAGPYQNIRVPGEHKLSLFPEGLAAVVKNNKIGFIDMQGNVKIPFKFYYSESWFNYCSFSLGIFSEGLAPMMNSGKKWGYIDQNGEAVIPFQYDGAYCFHKGAASVCKVINSEVRWGLIDKNNNVILPFEFEKEGVYTGNVYVMCQNNKWGVYSPQGECITPCQYDQTITFVEGYATVVKGGKQGLIDEQGQVVIPCENKSVLYDMSSQLVYVVKENGKQGYVDMNNQVVVPIEFDNVSVLENGQLFRVEKDGHSGLYDRCGNNTLD